MSYLASMNLKTVSMFAVGGGILFFLLKKKSLVRSAKFSFEKLDFNLKARKIKIVLGVMNPTSTAASINSIVGSLIVNGSEVASVENYTKVNILPSAKSLLPLTLTPSAAGIFSVLKTFVKNKLKGAGKSMAIFEGTANIGGASFPIKTQLI